MGLSEIFMIVSGILGLIAGYFGVKSKIQKTEIKSLKKDIDFKDGRIKTLRKQSEVQRKKTTLHKEVAKIIAKKSNEKLDAVEKLQKKIDKADNNEEFIITI